RRDGGAAAGREAGRPARPLAHLPLCRAGRCARDMGEQPAGARRALALHDRAGIPGARRLGQRRRAGAGGARHAPSRQGDPPRHDGRRRREALDAALPRNRPGRHDEGRRDRHERRNDEDASMDRKANGAIAPKPLLSVADGVLLMCGMVIGAGIFRAPSVVAANTDSGLQFLAAWVLGGAISLCGALVYAELASRYPETGGEYAFLSRGWGRGTAFVFAWARMT